MSAAGNRGPGRPRRIDRAQIVAAAREVGSDRMTMQAVADRLGVDRTALNYHVSGREGLLALLVIDEVAERFASTPIPENDGWRAACERYVRAVRDALVTAGKGARGVHLADARLLRPVEAVLRTLILAGLDVRTSGRIVTTLSNAAEAAAQDVLATEPGQNSPHLEELAVVLAADDAHRFPILSAMVHAQVSAADAAQFELTIAVLLDGIGHLVDRRAEVPL